jgi:RNA polymerase-binding transcription factor DksA
MLKGEQFKERLVADKQRLEHMIHNRRESSMQHGETSVNDSFSDSGDNEYADNGTDTFYQEMDMTMLNKYRHRLNSVNSALARIKEHTYGICTRCHMAISPGRLDAIPETLYCRDCEGEVELQD